MKIKLTRPDGSVADISGTPKQCAEMLAALENARTPPVWPWPYTYTVTSPSVVWDESSPTFLPTVTCSGLWPADPDRPMGSS